MNKKRGRELNTSSVFFSCSWGKLKPNLRNKLSDPTYYDRMQPNLKNKTFWSRNDFVMNHGLETRYHSCQIKHKIQVNWEGDKLNAIMKSVEVR